MQNFIAIKLKSLFLLTVFTANFYSVCHCKGITTSHTALSAVSQQEEKQHREDNCCDDDQPTGKGCTDHQCPCDEKKGCCGAHAVKFSLLEKQTVQSITIHPVFFAGFINHFIVLSDIDPRNRTDGKIEDKWLHKHSPPDLQSLYQRFQI